jgi:hypothetical protein
MLRGLCGFHRAGPNARPPWPAPVYEESGLGQSIEARSKKQDTELSPSETGTGIPLPTPVSGDGDQILMGKTPPFRGISSATRFRMR